MFRSLTSREKFDSYTQSPKDLVTIHMVYKWRPWLAFLVALLKEHATCLYSLKVKLKELEEELMDAHKVAPPQAGEWELEAPEAERPDLPAPEPIAVARSPPSTSVNRSAPGSARRCAAFSLLVSQPRTSARTSWPRFSSSSVM